MQEQYSVGIYARLSRDDERAGESVSIENQKEMLARYVREQGWTLYDYYCDDGVSGTTFDRPGFNRLVQDATDHKINLVLTKDDCVIIEPTQKDLENQGSMAGSVCFLTRNKEIFNFIT